MAGSLSKVKVTYGAFPGSLHAVLPTLLHHSLARPSVKSPGLIAMEASLPIHTMVGDDKERGLKLFGLTAFSDHQDKGTYVWYSRHQPIVE